VKYHLGQGGLRENASRAVITLPEDLAPVAPINPRTVVNFSTRPAAKAEVSAAVNSTGAGPHGIGG